MREEDGMVIEEECKDLGANRLGLLKGFSEFIFICK